MLETLPEGGSYPGFVFARGGAARRGRGRVRAAHARLQFRIESLVMAPSGRLAYFAGVGM